MKKFLFSCLCVSFLQASFIKAVAEPDLVIDYKDSIFFKNNSYYSQDTKVRLVYDNAILVFLPFGLWMESGIKMYESIYSPMVEEMLRPVKAAKAAQIILKLANKENVTQKDIDFLTMSTKVSVKIPYKPYQARLDIDTFEKKPYLSIVQNPQNDITYKTYEIDKVDVMHKKGFNFFFLFPKTTKHLILNNIMIPPVVFVEYNSIFYTYELNFEKRKASLYKKQFSKFNKKRKLKKVEKEFFNKLTTTPKFIIDKHFKEFATIYAEFLRGKQ